MLLTIQQISIKSGSMCLVAMATRLCASNILLGKGLRQENNIPSTVLILLLN